MAERVKVCKFEKYSYKPLKISVFGIKKAAFEGCLILFYVIRIGFASCAYFNLNYRTFSRCRLFIELY